VRVVSDSGHSSSSNHSIEEEEEKVQEWVYLNLTGQLDASQPASRSLFRDSVLKLSLLSALERLFRFLT